MDKKESLDTLGLQNGATHDEIKKKFRKLAKKSHPDLNKDKVKATNDFIKLRDAYDTLLNEKKTEPPNTSKVHTNYNGFRSFFDSIIDEINNFFRPRKYKTSEVDISNPEPFVDLRRIVKERKSKRDFY
ncbi:MAG: DnaJ domain-containing protein [Candidatus Heimdallarchaeota archaeon]